MLFRSLCLSVKATIHLIDIVALTDRHKVDDIHLASDIFDLTEHDRSKLLELVLVQSKEMTG